MLLATAVNKMVLSIDPNFECHDAGKNLENRLIIHDSPPFGLYDIFNHLIYHSSDYDKQGLASYKAYDDYRLYDDGYLESLSTVTLKESGVHVYVGKVNPTMRTKTDDGKLSTTICG